MSESHDDDQGQDGVGISDDLLPEDLQPSEDNPLAERLDDGETVDDLLTGGKDAEQLDDSPDSTEATDSPQEASEESGDESPD